MVKKKLLSLLIAAVMVLAMVPATAWADEEDNSCAKIGDTEYSTVQEAVNAAENGDTIEIIGKSDTTEILLISGKAVYITVADGVDFNFSIDDKTECITYFWSQHKDTNPRYLNAYIIGDLEKAVELASDSTFKSNLTKPYMPLFYVYTDIELDSNIELPSYDGTSTGIYVETDETGITIDLNGYTISQEAGSGWSGYPAISVNMGTLTIKDSAGKGKVVGASIGVDIYDYTVEYPSYGYTPGKLILESGTIATEGISYEGSNPQYGSVIRMYDGGTFEMTGGSLSLAEVEDHDEKLMGTIYLRGSSKNNDQDFNIEIKGGTVDVVTKSGIATVSTLESDGLIGYNEETVTFDADKNVEITGGVFGDGDENSTEIWKNNAYLGDGLSWINNANTATKASYPRTVGATTNASITVGKITVETTNTTVIMLTSEGLQQYLSAKANGEEPDLMDYVEEFPPDGTIDAATYTEITDGDPNGGNSAFVLFFAKPDDECALITFQSSTDDYVHSISTFEAGGTTIKVSETYRKDIVEDLPDGYVAILGYSRTESYNKNVPAFTVTAVSEKLVEVEKTITEINGVTVENPDDAEVYEGDVITYEITVTRKNALAFPSNKNFSYNTLTLSDTLIGINEIIDEGDWVETNDTDIQSYTYSSYTSYTVDSTDVDDGEIINTVTVDYTYNVNLSTNYKSAFIGAVTVKTTCPAYFRGTFTVIFDSNGGGSVASQTVKEGEKATEPDEPTRKGYTFVGWYLDEDFEYEYDFDYPVEDDTILYAKWTKNKSNSGGGSSYSLDEVDTSDDDDEEDYESDIKLNTEEHFQYISGYPDGTVRPTANITRAEVATIFYRLLDDNTRNAYYSTYTTFDDVDSSQWYLKAIATLTNAGILHGDSDSNTFRPDDNITRAEFATIVSFFDEIVYTTEDAFSDISRHWANVYINSAYAKGWVSGYDGKYNPDTAITRAEAMTLINNVLGREVDEDGLHEDAKQWPDNLEYAWYYYEVLEATNYHEYVRDGEAEVWTDILPNKTWNEGSASA